MADRLFPTEISAELADCMPPESITDILPDINPLDVAGAFIIGATRLLGRIERGEIECDKEQAKQWADEVAQFMARRFGRNPQWPALT